jgi:hypothetical protein
MAMTDLTAQRTLVKSPPELWSELSEVENLARHLGELGEIRIVKVEPESTVAWEGEQVSGTVELEQSGWGTKVTFRATVPEPDAGAEPEAVAIEPEAVAEPEPAAERAADAKPAAVEPIAETRPVAEAEPIAVDDRQPVAIEREHQEVESERQGFFAKWLFRRRQPAREPVAVKRGPVAAMPEPFAVESGPVAAVTELGAVEPDAVAAVSGSVAVEPDPVPAAVEPEPVEREPVTAEPETVVATAADRVQQVLDGTLDTLGQAHHRPFSRG